MQQHQLYLNFDQGLLLQPILKVSLLYWQRILEQSSVLDGFMQQRRWILLAEHPVID